MRGVLAGRAVYALSDAELACAAEDIRDTVRVLQAELIAVAAEQAGRNSPRLQGYSSLPSWLNAVHKVGVGTAAKMARLIKLLPDLPAVADAFAAGVVSEAQAAEIAFAAEAVPAGMRDEAAQVLLSQASALKPEELRIAGRRILRHVDPDAAEEHERKQLQREERAAWEARGFTVTSDGTGRFRLSGSTTAEGAAVLQAALDPLCNPARSKPSSSWIGCIAEAAACACPASQACNCAGKLADIAAREMAETPLPQAFRDPRSPQQRRHDALLEVVELALAAEQLPENGGARPQTVITANYDPVEQEVRAGLLDTGEQLTPEAVRRLACDAGIIPAILDTHSIPLDVGRERRLISGALRRALVLRDKGCAFPGCERPPRWCHGHHINHWIDGGNTSLGNSVLICGFHHRLIHEADWQITIAADGIPEFIPPVWLDPSQHPQRNLYHRRP